MTTELVLKPKQLTLADIGEVLKLGHVEGETLLVERSPKGYKLKTPTAVPLDSILAVGQRGLVEYIIRSLASERPRLIPFVLENQSLIELARYFLRYRTGSAKGLYVYTNTIHLYSDWLGYSPDEIIADCKSTEGLTDPGKVRKHAKLLEDFLGGMQDRHLSPGRINAAAKHVKALYRVNEVDLKLRYSLPSRVTNKDRAPRPEELQRLMEVGDPREKVIISMLALGGFREGTMVRLHYRHVREDLEKGIVPVHVHVEAEITKGKYGDYDTFLGSETVEALKLYLNARRKGLLDNRIPREELTDDSPLLRDHQRADIRPIGEKQLYKLIHSLYSRLGLLRRNENGAYDLRVHSLRKFFKTQLMALGVQSDYVDYMMGHTVDTYHDIQSKGIEFLRNVYATAGLSIAPKPRGWELDALKAFARGLGLEPEKVLTQDALAEPHRTYATREDREQAQTRVLSIAIKELIKKELQTSQESPNPKNSLIEA